VWTTAVLIHEQGGLGWWRRGRWEEGGREGRKKSVIGQNGHSQSFSILFNQIILF
jgi:hypothetical protein